jgi:hypothetical protein
MANQDFSCHPLDRIWAWQYIKDMHFLSAQPAQNKGKRMRSAPTHPLAAASCFERAPLHLSVKKGLRNIKLRQIQLAKKVFSRVCAPLLIWRCAENGNPPALS